MTENGIHGISRGRFIKLGGALGVGAASASLLVSCGGSGGSDGGDPGGGYGGGGGEGSGASGETSGSTGGSGSEAIAQVSDVEAGSAVSFQNDGEPAVLVRLRNEEFVAYSAVCTHQGCEVAYEAGEGTLNCPCHGSVFDPSQGAQPQSGPAQRPLSDIPVEVQGGEVVRA